MSVSADSNQPFIRLLLHKPPFQPIQTPILSAPTKKPPISPETPQTQSAPSQRADHLLQHPSRTPYPGAAATHPPAGATGRRGLSASERTNGVGCLWRGNTTCFPATDIQHRLYGQRREPRALWPRSGRVGGRMRRPHTSHSLPSTENQTTKSDSTPVYPRTISNHP